MLAASSTVLGNNMFSYTENNPVMNIDPSGYGKCFASASTYLNSIGCVGGGGGWTIYNRQPTDLGKAANIVGNYNPDWNTMPFDVVVQRVNDGMSVLSDVIKEILVPLASGGQEIGTFFGNAIGYIFNAVQVFTAMAYYMDNIQDVSVRNYAIILEFMIVFGADLIVDAIVTATGLSGVGIGVSFLLTAFKTPLSNGLSYTGRAFLREYGEIYG